MVAVVSDQVHWQQLSTTLLSRSLVGHTFAQALCRLPTEGLL